MRCSLRNSGEKVDNTPFNADENLDHMEVSQLLNYVNQGTLATQSNQQPSTSFSTLLKFDMDESEVVDSSLNTTTEVI